MCVEVRKINVYYGGLAQPLVIYRLQYTQDVLLFNWMFLFKKRVSFSFILAIILVKDYYIRCLVRALKKVTLNFKNQMVKSIFLVSAR